VNRSRIIIALFAVAALAGAVVSSCRTTQTSVPPVSQTGTRPITPGTWTAPEPVAIVAYNNQAAPCDPASVVASRLAPRFAARPLVRARQAAGVLPLRLQRYCVLAPIPVNPAQQGPLPTIAGSDREELVEHLKKAGYTFDFDYPVVQLSASPLETAKPAHRTTFLQRAGAPDASQVVWPSGLNPMRIALVDSIKASGAGWSYGALATDKHAAPLARLIEELVCEAGNPKNKCLAEVIGYNALQNTTSQGDPAGALHDLADAITEAVVDAKGKPQVVNLSLGWVPVPQLGGQNVNSLPAPAQAVYDALKFAVCNNSVVFAAAGNNLGGPNGAFDTGPVYPAGWQADVSVNCKDYGASGSYDGSLVHAVGGVTAKANKMALTRAQSFSTLAAYGVDGTAWAVDQPTNDPDEHTAPMTGTSVATAVASAAAAARWVLEPSLDRKTLPIALRQVISGSPDAADWPYPVGVTTVSRLRVCEQAAAACVSNPGCGGQFSCLAETAPGPTSTELSTIASQLASKTVSGLVQKTCIGGPVWGPPGNTTCMDGYTKSIDESPWVHPQPGCDPCLSCLFQQSATSASGLFFGDLNDDCLTAHDSWLVLDDGSTQLRIDLGGIVEDAGLQGDYLGASTDGVVLEGLPTLSGSSVRSRIVVDAMGDGVNSSATELPVLP